MEASGASERDGQSSPLSRRCVRKERKDGISCAAVAGIGARNSDGYFGSGQEVAATCALFDSASEKFASLLAAQGCAFAF